MLYIYIDFYIIRCIYAFKQLDLLRKYKLSTNIFIKDILDLLNNNLIDKILNVECGEKKINKTVRSFHLRTDLE
jgi:hypothetical protein